MFMLIPMLYGIGRLKHRGILLELTKLVDAAHLRQLLDPRQLQLKQLRTTRGNGSGFSDGQVDARYRLNCLRVSTAFKRNTIAVLLGGRTLGNVR